MPENTPNNRGANLTQQDRIRGGAQSARQQRRDEHGQFAGKIVKPATEGNGHSRSEHTSERKNTSRPRSAQHTSHADREDLRKQRDEQMIDQTDPEGLNDDRERRRGTKPAIGAEVEGEEDQLRQRPM